MAPPTAAPPVAPPATAAITPAWRQALASWLAAHKAYPDAARRLGLEGAPVVRFTVDRTGHVQAATLEKSSGSEILDSAALELLRGARLPELTPEMTAERITVSLRVRFALQN